MFTNVFFVKNTKTNCNIAVECYVLESKTGGQRSVLLLELVAKIVKDGVLWTKRPMNY